MSEWHATKHPGVRYREHPTRRHGVRPDRYFTLRHRHRRVRCEEGLGWASAGWTAMRAAAELGKLRVNARTGTGPVRLSEARELADTARASKAAEQATRVAFRLYFEEVYSPAAAGDRAARTMSREASLVRRWAYPVLAELPLHAISAFHVEKVKNRVKKAGETPRTVRSAIAAIRQVFRHAQRMGDFTGRAPTAGVKLPQFDDRRQRFLSRAEADALLGALEGRCPQVAAMALLALHGGLRAGEILRLTWADVDVGRRALLLRDTKNGATAGVTMSDDIVALFGELDPSAPSSPVFSARHGRAHQQVPRVFFRVVDALGLNRGVDDRRLRVCFHTLRHTFASWLVADGTDLYVVRSLMRHATIAQTERYAHLGPGTMARAIAHTFSRRPRLCAVTKK